MDPSPVPTLADGTVTLRAHRLADAERLWEQCHDPASRRWTTVPLDYTRSMATGFVSEVMPAGWADGSEWGFALEVDGRFGGTVSLRDEGGGRVELAFGAHPDVRGTGAVERGLRLLLAWGFQQPDVQTVVWRAHVGNWASRRLAWRLGFALEGTLRSYLPHRGELRDAWFATLLRDDPREPRHAWFAVPELEAEGLLLRAWRTSDLPRIVEACSDEESQRWLGRLPTPYDETAARHYLEVVTEELATGSGITWAVTDADRPDLALAMIGFFDHTPGVGLELGYWAHPDARGRGVVTRAARRVVQHAFEEIGARRVRALAATGNTASRRVLEACGLTRTGLERRGTVVRQDGETVRVDAVVYDVVVEERRERRSAAPDQSSTAIPSSDRPKPTSAGER